VFSEKNKNVFENKFSNVLNTYCWISAFVFGSIVEMCDVFETDLRKFSIDVLKKEDHVTQWKLKPRWHVHVLIILPSVTLVPRKLVSQFYSRAGG
jgi:hypothetical protein